jgi:hypothetical protein
LNISPSNYKRFPSGQTQWLTPIIPTLRRLKQEDLEFKVSLAYIGRPCLKKKERIFLTLLFNAMRMRI